MKDLLENDSFLGESSYEDGSKIIIFCGLGRGSSGPLYEVFRKVSRNDATLDAVETEEWGWLEPKALTREFSVAFGIGWED
jgi:hypothetical protein